MIVVWIVILLLISACQSPAAITEAENNDVLYQYSTLGSLMAGVYDGALTFGELKNHGDFGLGTFNTLDGEMIEVDHQVYQVKSDGVAYPVDDEQLTPFAAVTFFDTDQTITVTDAMDCDALKEYIDSLLPTENIPYAIKVEGNFSSVKTRSVPAQVRPYPPLLDVIADQPTFDLDNVDGVMLGFRLPDYMDIANSPGYHFHFINNKRNAGGHVLACQVKNVTVTIDYTDEWYMQIPEDSDFYGVEFSRDEYQ